MIWNDGKPVDKEVLLTTHRTVGSSHTHVDRRNVLSSNRIAVLDDTCDHRHWHWRTISCNMCTLNPSMGHQCHSAVLLEDCPNPLEISSSFDTHP